MQRYRYQQKAEILNTDAKANNDEIRLRSCLLSFEQNYIIKGNKLNHFK